MNKIYNPSVPEAERIALMMSDLYRPALHIASKMQMQVSSFTKSSNSVTVLEFASHGALVLRVVQNGDQYFAHIINSVKSIHGFDTVIETNKPMYLAKAITKDTTKAWDKLMDRIHDAERLLPAFIEGHVRLGYNSLVDNRKTHMSYRESLNNSTLAALVEVFFNERNAIDVRPDIREALETVRNERDRRENFREEVDGQMRRMFEPRKWFVTYKPTFGYTVRQIDIAHSWEMIRREAVHDIGNKPGVVETVPMQFFRSLEDMPEALKSEILPSLTYAKLHMHSRHHELKFDTEPHDLVPYMDGYGSKSIMSADTGVSYLTYDSMRSVLIDAG
jgi:hypothetical protein